MSGPELDEDGDFWWDTDLDHAGQSIWGYADENDDELPWTPF